MHATLRAYLTSPNVPLAVHPNANCSTARNDAASLRWPVVDAWQRWTDFNIENIDTLLGTLLDTSFEVADPPPPLKSSRLLRHDSQFDFVLVRRNNVIVNEALRVACSHLGLDQVEWTRGENESGEGTFPDWSGILVSGSDVETNLIPGDTKFTRNLFRARTVEEEGSEQREQWEEALRVLDSDELTIPSPLNSETELTRSCLQQVNHYATARKVRYFYVITNKELFLCRRTQDLHVDSPIAARRTKRLRVSHLDSTPTRLHTIPPSSPPSIIRRSQRLVGPVSLDQVARDLPSSHPASPAIPSLPGIFSDFTYQGDDADDDTGVPECISIPWDEKEGESLTVNLGLFVIHLLALISNEIRTEYEPFYVDPEYCAKLKVQF